MTIIPQKLLGDSRQTLKVLPEKSVHCCITSPPYWGLRSYLPKDHPLKALEIGCEPTFELYLDHLLEVFREATRIAQLDRPVGDWPAAVTRLPGEVMGLATRGRFVPGAAADLVLFNARGYSELLSRPQADRIVLRDGVPIDTTLPDYRELDPLMQG